MKHFLGSQISYLKQFSIIYLFPNIQFLVSKHWSSNRGAKCNNNNKKKDNNEQL